jgi:hypothetical protein
LRIAPAGYADGLSEPAGAARPSARACSNELCAQGAPVLNEKNASDYIWQWGQFLDHDIDLTGGASPAEPFSVVVPTGDPFFDPGSTGTATIALDRSAYVIDSSGVRQQLNAITAWIDGSNVYGSDEARALELRRLDGTGMLKTTSTDVGELLPYNLNGFPNAPTDSDPTLFLAGDVRCNEQAGLAAMHTLFVREHNAIAALAHEVFPELDGDRLYELARAVVVAEMQRITYEEFLPVLLGPGALPPYHRYDRNVEPGIDNLFSTASYRFGHSLLSPQLLRLGADLQPIAEGNLPLRNAFFNPAVTEAVGIEPILRGLSMQIAQRVDAQVVDDVRNFLFGPPGSGGFDLASLNIQRGRDHGLASYNEARSAYGLAPATSFADITADPAAQAKLQAMYGSVDEVDAWVGGLAEDHAAGAMVGELVKSVLAHQFRRLRDGDRFWYQRYLGPRLRHFVEQQTLSRIIRRNTSIGDELPENVFLVAG